MALSNVGEESVVDEVLEEDSGFGPSELGQKYYWDSFYELELQNFYDHGDQGEIWFGHRTMNAVVDWIEEKFKATKHIKIIDLGCGNGVFLMKLKEKGFTNLLGIDYSEVAVSLAMELAKTENLSIEYKVVDITSKDNLKSSGILKEKFDLCTDKGTYDAISLSPDEPIRIRQTYKQNVCHLLPVGGLFVLTSCNWTEEELLEHFQQDFCLVTSISMPCFQYGGRTGQTVTSLVFKRVES